MYTFNPLLFTLHNFTKLVLSKILTVDRHTIEGFFHALLQTVHIHKVHFDFNIIWQSTDVVYYY